MPHHGRRTSTTSLLSTNTTSSSFDPTRGKTKPPQVRKDYATAFSTLQSKYGIPEISSMSAPVPLPSKKSPTSKPLPALAEPLGTTNPSSSTATAHYPRNRRDIPPPFPSFGQGTGQAPSSSTREGEERGDNGDGIKRVDGATASRSSDDGN
ncbi:hypothetical protein BC826DRAFT_969572 [Russula brevipes]|nr:hypothetical protein BC826DRAFT_969572 [Russula brevipes]